MRYLIFTLALMSAFFVFKSYAESTVPEGYPPEYSYPPLSPHVEKEKIYMCGTRTGSKVRVPDKAACYAVANPDGLPISTGIVDPEYPTTSTGSVIVIRNNYAITSGKYTISWGEDIYSCPPPISPDHIIPIKWPLDAEFISCAKPITPEPEPEPEPDPDCPAPTDNDPYVFGSGGGQTSVCFPAPNGRQCEIQTDENGGYYIPASYGSAEPVSCIPDIDPSPDPDPTPDPEPKPDPDPTDPDPETTELDAINKINENLDVINNNQKTYSESNDERLDRIALEIQNSNQILSDIKSKPVSGGGAYVNNGALLEIAENTKKDLYNGECEGELCDYDIQPKLDEENAKLKEWIEKEEPAPSILNTYTSKITSYVSQNFAGFTGTCQPFILDVSIAGSQKIINVSQHCEPYETYFKPLVEWLLWTFTAIALINISSQAFRAFSSL